jgi:hypothetical protein
MTNLAPQTRQPAPVATPAPAPKFQPQRIDWRDDLPQTLQAQYAKALAAAGWSFDVASVTLTNKGKTAKLDALAYDFADWCKTQQQFPSYQRLAAMQTDVTREVLERLPRVGKLLS